MKTSQLTRCITVCKVSNVIVINDNLYFFIFIYYHYHLSVLYNIYFASICVKWGKNDRVQNNAKEEEEKDRKSE